MRLGDPSGRVEGIAFMRASIINVLVFIPVASQDPLEVSAVQCQTPVYHIHRAQHIAIPLFVM